MVGSAAGFVTSISGTWRQVSIVKTFATIRLPPQQGGVVAPTSHPETVRKLLAAVLWKEPGLTMENWKIKGVVEWQTSANAGRSNQRRAFSPSRIKLVSRFLRRVRQQRSST